MDNRHKIWSNDFMKSHDTYSHTFPGGLDTTVIAAQESGRAPFDGQVIPPERWSEFTEGFSKAYDYVHSPEGVEFYKQVNAELLKIAVQSPQA